MSIKKLWLIVEALRAGKELRNADNWKHVQAISTALLTIAAAVVAFLPPELVPDPSQLEGMAYHLAEFLVGVFSLYLTYATSKRVGMPSSGELDDPSPTLGRGDGGSEAGNYRGGSEG